jgi:hypothetical protein
LIDICILLLAIHLFVFTITDKLLVTVLYDVLFYIWFFDSAFSSDYIMLNDWMISIIKGRMWKDSHDLMCGTVPAFCRTE